MYVKEVTPNGEARSRMFSVPPNSGFAIGRDPAAFDHIMRQVVEVEGNPIPDHLIDIEQMLYLRDIAKEKSIKRSDQGF